jgi:hypothetical protein
MAQECPEGVATANGAATGGGSRKVEDRTQVGKNGFWIRQEGVQG